MASLKHAPQIHVPVLPQQKIAIEANARAVRLPVATFLRNLGLQHQVTGVADQKAVDELARIAADLGRLGGLLKLWLTSDDKFTDFDHSQQVRQRVLALLQRLMLTQSELHAAMERVVGR